MMTPFERVTIVCATFALGALAPGIAVAQAPAFLMQWSCPGSYPNAIAVDPDGFVYVTDGTHDRILKFNSRGTYVTQWGSHGSGAGQFNGISYGLATDAAGNVYVSDTGNNRIQKFKGDGTFITQWGSYGSGVGQLDSPYGIAIGVDAGVNRVEYLYVVDSGNMRVEKFLTNGAVKMVWPMLPNRPGAIGADAAGNVYVWEGRLGRIIWYNSGGAELTEWGSYGTGDGQFKSVSGVAVDALGHVYVADPINYRIQMFDTRGGLLAKWGSLGSGEGQFKSLTGLAVDIAGDLYAADAVNQRVELFGTGATSSRPTSWGEIKGRYR